MSQPASVDPSFVDPFAPGRRAETRPGPTTHPPLPDGLRLLHADDSLLALDKPAGLLAVPGRGADKADCLARRVQALYPDALVVHRLDQATSGLMLFARGLAMQRRLSRAFEQREIHKRYLGVAASRLGTAAGDGGRIDLPLMPDWPNRPLQKVDHEHGRPALTHWQVLAHGSATNGLPVTRLALHPVTGRSHQLRLHLAAIGHPLLGDALYAPPDVQAAAPRLLLHAEHLALAHPASGAPLVLQADAPF
jgi:tRNA pseudouridine32 synthase/23S rRNA pseudouridine746 synthase